MKADSDGLTMHSSVGIKDDCPMRFRAFDNGIVEFHAGRELEEEFDLTFDVDALRRFIELGTRALAKADNLQEKENGHGPAPSDLALRRMWRET